MTFVFIASKAPREREDTLFERAAVSTLGLTDQLCRVQALAVGARPPVARHFYSPTSPDVAGGGNRFITYSTALSRISR